MPKYTFHGKHRDSHDIDSQQGSLATLMRLRDLENTVFDFTSDARVSKCKQQKRGTARTLGIPCDGMCPEQTGMCGTRKAPLANLWPVSQVSSTTSLPNL